MAEDVQIEAGCTVPAIALSGSRATTTSMFWAP